MFKKQLGLLATLLIAGAMIGFGCAAPGDGVSSGEGSCAGGKCDHATPEHDLWSTPFVHQWALDLSKVRQHTGHYTERVVAATREEIALPDELWSAACEQERLVAPAENSATGEVTGQGGCYLWGNSMRVNYDHTWHDDSEVIINLVDDTDGDGSPDQYMDIPGYLNIIALKNADRNDQGEIHQYLRNGDILVYFHPEDDDTFQYRMHHAAMYYDTHEYDGEGGPVALTLGDSRYTHHIDNPTSYGPAFNAGVRSVPFHVYRFNPNGAPGTENRNAAGEYEFTCTDSTDSELCEDGKFTISDEDARAYAYASRNWALLTNGSAPFSSFHKMSWLDDHQLELAGTSFMDHMDRYSTPITGGETLPVYCAGLVYTNLNLGLNRPMNENGLTSGLLTALQGGSYDFDDNYMQATFPGTALMAGQENLRTTGQLVFPLAQASDIIDAWAEGYFRNMDATFTQLAGAAKAGSPEHAAQVTGMLQQFQLAGNAEAAAKVIEFFSAEQLGAILAQSGRMGVIDGAAENVARGFSQLRNQANKSSDGAQGNHAIATPERVKQYALAYGGGFRIQLSADQAGDVESLTAIAMGGLPLAHVGDGIFMMDRATIALDISAPAGERLTFTPGAPDGQADFLQIKDVEMRGVENRYVPPPMYHWEANRPGSVISYVGTVFHVDLLSPLTDGAHDGGGDVPEFAEGGPDSSQYGHYNIPNGGRHVQRVLDVNAGPELVGPGSEIMTRISASNISDVRVVLHPAGTFAVTDRYLCDDRGRARAESGEINTDCIDLRTAGIALPLPADGASWDDQMHRWTLFAPVSEGGAGCVVEDDGRRTCPAFDWDTNSASETERFELGEAHGMWTISTLDLGNETTGAEIEHCLQCPTGGAHSNQWFIKVRNDSNNEPAELPAMGPGQVWESSVDHEQTKTRSFVVPEDLEGSANYLVRLVPTSGDPDLTVETASGDYVGDSANGSGSEDSVEIEGATAGAVYKIAIYGYEQSDFTLVVERVGGGDVPGPAAPTMVDILNNADLDELTERANVAISPARLIVKGRTEAVELDASAGGGMRDAGPWTSLDEAVAVKGIGRGTARALESYLQALSIAQTN